MRLLAVSAALLLLFYPFAVYFGIHWLEPGTLGLLVAGLWALRALVLANTPQRRALIACACALVALGVWWLNSEMLLLLLPAFIHLAGAALFAGGLFFPPTVPARLAAREYGLPLPPPVLWYTTWVTRIWVVFFLLNAAVAATLALRGSRELWVLYNGLLAYVAVAALFAGEYAFRRLVFRRRHSL